ncbi:MAG: hypothetical protein WC269_04555, partial [Candidatus Gracilibacteria bacterium]
QFKKETSRLALVKARVAEKRAKLEQEMQKYQAKVDEIKAQFEKGKPAVESAINRKKDELLKILKSEFGITLNADDQKKLVEMLRNNSRRTMSSPLKIKGKDVQTMLDFVSVIGATDRQKKRILKIANYTGGLDDQLKLIENRLAKTGVQSFTAETVKERRENRELDAQWKNIFARMDAYFGKIGAGSKVKIEFSGIGGLASVLNGQDDKLKDLVVTHNAGSSIELKNTNFEILFQSDGKTIIKDLTPPTPPATAKSPVELKKQDSVNLIKALKLIEKQ